MLALAAVMAQVGIRGEMVGTSLKGMGEAQKSNALKKLFGEQGMPVALALLNEGKGSFAEISRAMEASISLQEKLRVSMEGFNKQLQSLRGTTRSLIAGLFLPALAPLTALLAKTNDWLTALGKAEQKNESIGKAVSGVSFGALGAGAAVSALAGGAALYYGRKALTGVGGIKGLFGSAASATAGIATGKAVEAAAGVTLVFVTNWPAGFGAGSALAETAAGGLAAKGKSVLSWLAGNISSLAKTTLPVAIAGTAGYGAGTLLNNYLLQGTEFQEKIVYD